MTKRILIVDDEEEICEVVQASLEELGGWLTIVATSSVTGLQIAKTEAIDAILLDVSMPDMDGLEMCAALQANPQTQKIPVVMLTAKVLPSDQQRFAELDVVGVIKKPFDPMMVWQQVAELLGWSV